MDVLNGGVAWEEPLKVEIEADEDTPEERVAQLVNRATYEDILQETVKDDDPALGKVVCWIDSEGHQGGTSVLIEWHQA
jgi:hypothetical protein